MWGTTLSGNDMGTLEVQPPLSHPCIRQSYVVQNIHQLMLLRFIIRTPSSISIVCLSSRSTYGLRLVFSKSAPSPVLVLISSRNNYAAVGTARGSKWSASCGSRGTQIRPVLGCTQNGALSEWLRCSDTSALMRGQSILEDSIFYGGLQA